MDELLLFIAQYGWQLGLIAIAGIVILGVLKYCNVFKSIDEKYRHLIYLGISVGVSVIASIVYLACVHQFTVEYVFAVAAAILALNQLFYAVYANTPLKELLLKALDFLKGLLVSNKSDQQIEDGDLESKDDSEKEGD